MGLQAAVPYYEQTVACAREMGILSYSYTLAAILGIAKAREEARDFVHAEEHYKWVKRLAKRKSKWRREAKKGLRRLKKNAK